MPGWQGPISIRALIRGFDSIVSLNKSGSEGYSTDLSIRIDCTESYSESVEFEGDGITNCSKTIQRIMLTIRTRIYML